MNAVDWLKDEKRLSLYHWRYRLLHWTFGVKQGKQSDELPVWMYTQYCPLFHITNLLAVVLPIIALVKCFLFVVKICITFKDWLVKKRRERQRCGPQEPLPPTKEGQLRLFQSILAKDLCSFEAFWSEHNSRFSLISEQEAREYYTKLAATLMEREDARLARKERRQAMIVWLIQKSNWFFKGCLSIGYYIIILAIVALLLIGLYYGIHGCIGLFMFFASEPGLLGWLLLTAVVIFVLAIFFWYFLTLEWIIERIPYWDSKLTRPFVFATAKFFVPVGHFMVCVIEFCSMFYENNCPPIVLLEDESTSSEKSQPSRGSLP